MRISEILSSVTSAYDDWSDFLANPQHIRRDNEVAWRNFSPRVLDYPVLKSDVVRMAEERQYTFQIVEDGSLIQIHYFYNRKGDQILSANLAFYSAILNGTETTNNGDEPVSWLRIDYAPEAARGVLHHDCHMHLSSFPDSRFVVAGLLTPKQFIELIMAFCYPESY